MHEGITLIRDDALAPSGVDVSADLPADLLGQVRSRVKLLTVLLLIGFLIDPLVFGGILLVTSITGAGPPADFWQSGPSVLLSLTAASGSAGLWLVARSRAIPATRLLAFGLLYEVLICLIIALGSFWSNFVDFGDLPRVTWVPAIIIMFPLILPGPPRRMLAGAVAGAAMSPVALVVLDLSGRVTTTPNAYFHSAFSPAIAVFFAYFGARTVYGLGREVVKARQMGSYHLEERLGQGGMGEVWRASHRMLARPAAIKLIRPEMLVRGRGAGADVSLRRFEREAQATAALRSPHTVELYDFGSSSDGTLYYVMELLDGFDAETLVKRYGPMPPERAVYVLTQICHSLSEAHAADLIHRDIKPANVFVCRYGQDLDYIKVLDFGLVKTQGEVVPSEQALTADHVVGGTPAFIAPEQALGQGDLDGRADLYAVGCVAYWLLSGCLVFDGKTPLELLTHHVRSEPVPMSQRTELPIPADLEAVVLSCLAKDRDRRPRTASELSDRLAACDLADEWTPVRARAWWARHAPR